MIEKWYLETYDTYQKYCVLSDVEIGLKYQRYVTARKTRSKLAATFSPGTRTFDSMVTPRNKVPKLTWFDTLWIGPFESVYEAKLFRLTKRNEKISKLLGSTGWHHDEAYQRPIINSLLGEINKNESFKQKIFDTYPEYAL